MILNITDNQPKTRYILALDDSHNTLQEIIKAISSALGPGKIKNVLKEDALLNRDVTVSHPAYIHVHAYQIMFFLLLKINSKVIMIISW